MRLVRVLRDLAVLVSQYMRSSWDRWIFLGIFVPLVIKLLVLWSNAFKWSSSSVFAYQFLLILDQHFLKDVKEVNHVDWCVPQICLCLQERILEDLDQDMDKTSNRLDFVQVSSMWTPSICFHSSLYLNTDFRKMNPRILNVYYVIYKVDSPLFIFFVCPEELKDIKINETEPIGMYYLIYLFRYI